MQDSIRTPKVEYYTFSNINNEAKLFADKLSLFREKHKNQQVLRDKVALLVIDMQGFFCDSRYHAFVPSMLAIVPKIKHLQEFCLKNDISVYHTQHANTQYDSGVMLKWWGSINDANSPLSEIIPEVSNQDAVLIKKTQYDAFWKTDLETLLRAKGIEQVVITGVMTHLCCETTARAAFVRGFEVFFAIDGTATYNPEFHFNALYNLAHGFARPLLISEIINELGA